jgi:hypothetical protein
MDRHFFIVGAQRCGTSYLHTVLGEHPEIEMAGPLVPEPKFFLRDDFGRLEQTDYESIHFGGKPGVKRRGEKSTSYMEYELAARRISSWHPEAQIIFMLRDPAQRAISNYNFTRRNGLENLPLAEAVASEERRRDDYDHGRFSTSPYAYLKRGQYLSCIRTYERYFGRPQLILLIQEEMVGEIGGIQALYETLGVRKEFVPPSLSRLINADDGCGERPSEELRDFLTRHFAESVAGLEEYMGRAITAWRYPPQGRRAG